ncbi:hypothetical protein ACLB2K_063555 [Fragaria x ananassa]
MTGILQDLSHIFSSVTRDLNFIDHTSDLGWKELLRIQPIIVDPGIYLARSTLQRSGKDQMLLKYSQVCHGLS